MSPKINCIHRDVTRQCIGRGAKYQKSRVILLYASLEAVVRRTALLHILNSIFKKYPFIFQNFICTTIVTSLKGKYRIIILYFRMLIVYLIVFFFKGLVLSCEETSFYDHLLWSIFQSTLHTYISQITISIMGL